MVMDDIATQRETSRKTIRYEAHKFRQKNSKYYNHPMGTSAETQANGVNIAPPNWKPPNENECERKKPKSYDSDNDYSDSDGDGYSKTPRKQGIITRAKKPAVSFRLKKDPVEEGNGVDILDVGTIDIDLTQNETKSESKKKFRSVSAVPFRSCPDLPGQKRQFSAFPSVRDSKNQSRPFSRETTDESSEDKNSSSTSRSIERRSETYFDKSKAAYQLREELRKRAKMRKSGIKPSVFTLKDALQLEKDNYLKSKNKVVDYLRRIEAMKKSEMTIVNKWTRDAIVQQLNI